MVYRFKFDLNTLEITKEQNDLFENSYANRFTFK